MGQNRYVTHFDNEYYLDEKHRITRFSAIITKEEELYSAPT
jgi:hypothetical protein